jgi:hypothetical protein
MRDLLDKLSALENIKESNVPKIGDEIGFSFSPELEIVTEVVGFTEDGIVVELDETGLNHLTENGVMMLEGELIYEEKQKGIDGKACWKGYKRMGTKKKGGRTVDNCVKVGEGRFDFDDEDERPEDPEKDKVQHIVMQARKAYDVEGNYPIQFQDGSKTKIPLPMITKFLKMYNMMKSNDKEVFQTKAAQSPKDFQMAVMGSGMKESGLQYYTGKKKYGKDGMAALAQAGRDGASEEELGRIKDKFKKEEAEVDEAKYRGREVPLGKKMAGDVKKSKVYVRKPNGNIVKVNFGDKKMRIKKSNPARRKSFRARHNCKNPGPRWKARYWSCRSW